MFFVDSASRPSCVFRFFVFFFFCCRGVVCFLYDSQVWPLVPPRAVDDGYWDYHRWEMGLSQFVYNGNSCTTV